MTYTRKDLTKEINEIIQQKLEMGSAVIVDWIVHAILANHQEKGLSEFSKCARFEFVDDEVGRSVRRFKEPQPEELEQLVLDGFTRLQQAYRIIREKEQMIVPIDAMSDEELLEKAEEHGAMANGHNVHKRELIRYVKNRRAARRRATEEREGRPLQI